MPAYVERNTREHGKTAYVAEYDQYNLVDIHFTVMQNDTPADAAYQVGQDKGDQDLAPVADHFRVGSALLGHFLKQVEQPSADNHVTGQH